jgi:hypothetical protein
MAALSPFFVQGHWFLPLAAILISISMAVLAPFFVRALVFTTCCYFYQYQHGSPFPFLREALTPLSLCRH